MFTTREPDWAPKDGIEAIPAEQGDAWMRRPAPRSLFDPMDFILSVWRARYWIALAGVLGAGTAVGVALTTPKVYSAGTQLILDPRNLNLVQNEVTPNGLSSDATLALIQSQIAVITSNSVLSRVVEEANLTQDPEYNGTRPSLLEQILPSGLLLLLDDGEDEAADRALVTLTNFRKTVGASRNANSFVIDLVVTSEDPQKSARLANLAAEVFVGVQARAQSDIAGRASADLSARLSDLRQRVSDAEQAVEDYKADNRLVGVGGRLIDDEYILRINNQLADTRATITALDVRAQSMRQASVDDVVEGTIPEELSSEALVRLRQTYAELQQEQAVVAAQLGPRHPQRISGEQALASARRAIASELARIVASAQTELARARETERELTQQIDALRGEQIETSGAFVELRELERDVDASRAVYENYLLRARELAQQESLNTVNVRTISEATAPFTPSGMSRKIVVILGLFAGLALGFAIAAFLAIVRGVRLAFADRPAFAGPQVGGAYHGSYVALPAPRRPQRPVEEDRPSAPAAPDAEAPTAPMRRSEPSVTTSQADAPAASIVLSPLRPSGASEQDVRPEDATVGAEDVPSSAAIETPAGDSADTTDSSPVPETATEDAPAETNDPIASQTDDAPAPVASVSEDIADRRDRLRARIREIAARRAPAGNVSDLEAQNYVERGSGRLRRPTIAEMRRRRLIDRAKPTD